MKNKNRRHTNVVTYVIYSTVEFDICENNDNRMELVARSLCPFPETWKRNTL